MPGDIVSHNSPSWKPILGSGDPGGSVWSPGMVDVPLRNTGGIHNWFWHPDQDFAAHSGQELAEMYYTSVGQNCNFVIGKVITPDGLVPPSDINRLADFGAEIKRRFGKPVAQVKTIGTKVVLDLQTPQRIDHIVLQEDIRNGERVRAYNVYGVGPDNNSILLSNGECIGHKRIHKTEHIVSKIELEVTRSIDVPQITMYVYRTSPR